MNRKPSRSKRRIQFKNGKLRFLSAARGQLQDFKQGEQ